MKLIIGGAYQGKLEYVQRTYPEETMRCADGMYADAAEIEAAQCIYHYEAWIRRLLEQDAEPVAYTEALLAMCGTKIIVMNEIGNGIIPLERAERRWREAVGKTGCYLAEQSECVERIVCGIAQRIKG